jgi:hypothetical protein
LCVQQKFGSRISSSVATYRLRFVVDGFRYAGAFGFTVRGFDVFGCFACGWSMSTS